MFRPCIDLHEGKVKQIVGGTLTTALGDLRTNFISDRPARWFAELYRRDNLPGGHVIMLGPGNESAAVDALSAFPGGMHVGGGINPDNAARFLEAGASHVIVTSWIFRDGELDEARLRKLSDAVGKNRPGPRFKLSKTRWRLLGRDGSLAEIHRDESGTVHAGARLPRLATNFWSMPPMSRAFVAGLILNWPASWPSGRPFPRPTQAAQTHCAILRRSPGLAAAEFI